MTPMTYTYTDPTGQRFDDIPQIWGHNGRVHALAGDWTRAERLGWTREETTDVYEISKLALLDVLASLGIEETVMAQVEATPALHRRWLAAQVLRSDHPALLAALPAIASAAGKTEAEAMDLLRQAAGVEP